MVTDVGTGEGEGTTVNIPWQVRARSSIPSLTAPTSALSFRSFSAPAKPRPRGRGRLPLLPVDGRANVVRVCCLLLRGLPVQDAEVGDAEYLQALLHVVLPIGYEFQPDLVVVAAGFSAAEGDPFGAHLSLTSSARGKACTQIC